MKPITLKQQGPALRWLAAVIACGLHSGYPECCVQWCLDATDAEVA